MTRRSMLATVVLAAAGAGAAAAEAPVRLVAVPSSTTVTVGEPFIVKVRAEAPAGTTWSFPAEVAAAEVILKAVEAPATAGALYQGAVFALDEVTIPAITATYQLPDGTRGEAASEPVAVVVASLLPDDPEEQRLADLRPPVSLPAGAPFWIALGLLLAGLAGAAVWWWRRRRRMTGAVSQPALPEVPPADEALAALRRLQSAGLAERGELRAFYIELAVIAKRYLERRLEAPVLEMTSAETAAFLRDHPVARRMAATVRELTTAADHVKFARGQGDEARARRHGEQVRVLVDELERALAVPPDGESLQERSA